MCKLVIGATFGIAVRIASRNDYRLVIDQHKILFLSNVISGFVLGLVQQNLTTFKGKSWG
jgi:hypothetical protein